MFTWKHAWTTSSLPLQLCYEMAMTGVGKSQTSSLASIPQVYDFESAVVGGVLVVVLLEAAEDAEDENNEDADPLPGLDSPRSISGTSACLPWTVRRLNTAWV